MNNQINRHCYRDMVTWDSGGSTYQDIKNEPKPDSWWTKLVKKILSIFN